MYGREEKQSFLQMLEGEKPCRTGDRPLAERNTSLTSSRVICKRKEFGENSLIVTCQCGRHGRKEKSVDCGISEGNA